VERSSRLSIARRQAGADLASRLARALGELAMPKCRIEIRVTPLSDDSAWTRAGTDAVEFFLSPNPGEEPRPLARIASGGELSRIMLALRTLVADAGADAARTLVFDEVDAGIGGAAADAVGARLQLLGRRQQVLCVTHLAPIAARPGAHFHISKVVKAGRTITQMTRLDASGREMELARMIAGAEISASVVASAREMLAARRESESKAKGESPGQAKAKGRSRGA
jgi:DNA repair protein RecN (Recombination protein N)